jgi:hypothetical protein
VPAVVKYEHSRQQMELFEALQTAQTGIFSISKNNVRQLKSNQAIKPLLTTNFSTAC